LTQLLKTSADFLVALIPNAPYLQRPKKIALTGRRHRLKSVPTQFLYYPMKVRICGFVWRVICTAAILATAVTASDAADSGKRSSTHQSSKLDTITGFRDQKFGTPFSDFQGLTIEKDEGDVKLYSKKDDNLALGPAKLQAVIYYFFQDKFYGVSLHTEDRDDTLFLLRVAISAFGPGTHDSNTKDDLDQSWIGKNGEAFYNVNPKTEEGSLFIRDGALAAQAEAYTDKLAKDAGDSL
jgi:hypothetical protein